MSATQEEEKEVEGDGGGPEEAAGRCNQAVARSKQRRQGRLFGAVQQTRADQGGNCVYEDAGEEGEHALRSMTAAN